jgi:hypothetical protein
MTKTSQEKNVKTLKQNNVFQEIKNQSKRGRGLSSPATFTPFSNNTNKKESSEAVVVKNKRTARISTYITEEANDMIYNIITEIKKQGNKKPKIAEVIELSLTELYKTTLKQNNVKTE